MTVLRRIRYSAKDVLSLLPYSIRDARINRRWRSSESRFVILRHSGKSPYFHDYFLKWLATSAPEVRARFELKLLPHRSIDWNNVGAFSAWLQDPAIDWLPRRAYERVIQLQRTAHERGIAVVNPIERHANSIKSTGAEIIANAGVRTPSIRPIHGIPSQSSSFPFLIREDRGHGKTSIYVESSKQLNSINFSKFKNPIAVEFIDVRSPRDGLFRKYRYLAAGEFGVPRHLIVSREWEVRACQRVRWRSIAARRNSVSVSGRIPITNDCNPFAGQWVWIWWRLTTATTQADS